MDNSPIAMPLRLATGISYVHACLDYSFQSFLVHA
ncbi:hypothetical protein LMIY3S_05888 [Labrys miyagiensis]